MLEVKTINKIDPSTFNFTDIEYNSESELEITLDMGHLTIKNQIDQTFNQLLNQTLQDNDRLYILSKIRLLLKEGGKLNLINTYKGTINSGYLKRIEILLNKAGFVDIVFTNKAEHQGIQAKRRAVEIVKLEYGLTLKEVILPNGIISCHQFAQNYYYYKDLNYDLDAVTPFDLNCDHFAVFDQNNQILSTARIVIRTPGHYCPFMYATIRKRGDTGKHFIIPGKDKRIGEVMAIFSVGKKGIIAFKYMMEYLTQYGTKIAHLDSVWTTYDDSDPYTGTYYKKKFLMDETGIKLQYSDFGGYWNLLVTNKIKELKDRHNGIFKYK